MQPRKKHMSVGTNIRLNRERLKLSQKELADKLFVTPQAVSRWENDAVEPSIETLKQMSTIFGVSIDEITNTQEKKETDVTPTATPAMAVTPAAPIGKVIGQCHECHKDIHEGEEHGYGHLYDHVTYSGRGHHHQHHHPAYAITAMNITGHDDLVCASCLKSQQEAQQRVDAAEATQKKDKVAGDTKKAIAWGIVTGILALVIDIWVGVALVQNGNTTAGGWLLGLSPLVGYAFFAFLFVMIEDNTFVTEMFMSIVEFGFVKMPGVIFTFDADGLAFLIVVKVIFGIIGFLIFFAVFAFALVFSALCSIFAFPYSYKHRGE
jgi:DNA-binding XRE family transcriptional regulator